MKLKELLKNKIPEDKLKFIPSSFNIIGDICILEIKPEIKKYEKLIAKTLLNNYKNLKVIAKKSGIHKGKYRTQKIKILAGEKRRETIHKENNVQLKLNIKTCYFSPRLANERKRIASLVKPNESILIMFSGISPYSIIISKNTLAKEIYDVEINPSAYKYAKENLKLNNINNITLFNGNVKKILPKINKKFDRIIMPLPKDSKTYLDLALKKLKPKGIIHLYLFEEEKNFSKLKKQYLKKFKSVNLIKCGAYSPGVYRVCLDLKI